MPNPQNQNQIFDKSLKLLTKRWQRGAKRWQKMVKTRRKGVNKVTKKETKRWQKNGKNAIKEITKRWQKCDKKASGLLNQHVNSQLTILDPNPFRP